MTRRGLVLGAGGVLGFAWAVGALHALEQEEGFDCREVEVLVGTSAGAVTAALLGCGVGVDVMLRHQRGRPAADDPIIQYDYENDSGGALPPRPAPGIGSTHLLVRTALHPREVTPLAALSAVLPRGRGTLDPIGEILGAVLAPGQDWCPHPSTWIVAMDYDSGRRVAFGAPEAPPARLPEAVMASCAIPGWYVPVEIGGRRYVDGGTCSAASLDLLAGSGDAVLDEVYVLAPMASFAYDRPPTLAARLERRVRRAATRQLCREAETVTRAGSRVTLLGPGPADLAAIGANLMDPRRRGAVLETSLRTSAAALLRRRDPGDGDLSGRLAI